jgi:hypothetical protein
LLFLPLVNVALKAFVTRPAWKTVVWPRLRIARREVIVGAHRDPHRRARSSSRLARSAADTPSGTATLQRFRLAPAGSSTTRNQ